VGHPVIKTITLDLKNTDRKIRTKNILCIINGQTWESTLGPLIKVIPGGYDHINEEFSHCFNILENYNSIYTKPFDYLENILENYNSIYAKPFDYLENILENYNSSYTKPFDYLENILELFGSVTVTKTIYLVFDVYLNSRSC